MEYSLDVVNLETPLINLGSNPTRRCNRDLFHFSSQIIFRTCLTSKWVASQDFTCAICCTTLLFYITSHDDCRWIEGWICGEEWNRCFNFWVGIFLSPAAKLQTSRWYLLFRLNQFLKEAYPANHRYLDIGSLQQSMVLLSNIIHHTAQQRSMRGNRSLSTFFMSWRYVVCTGTMLGTRVYQLQTTCFVLLSKRHASSSSKRALPRILMQYVSQRHVVYVLQWCRLGLFCRRG